MAKFISPNKTIVTSTILPPRIISDETLPPRNLKTSSESDTSFTNSSINTSLYNSSPNSSVNLVTKNPSNLGLIDFDTLKATTNLTTLSLFDFAITNPPDPFDFGTQSAMTNSPTLNLIDLGTQNTTTNLSTFESNTIIALYDFMADHNNELSFMAGDSLVLKQRSTHNGWLVAELNGVTGLVPENYFI
ncbi:SH3-domain-containing protein [Gigaspora margarita]|uniref:SH3-domain-containing protein n=1 Tax=Gigaspora margarita TaxID=4874 RepID=A0A8H4ASM9_GIGMA|nr:SH3-domain-containing protein [Gigaspora margarita]